VTKNWIPEDKHAYQARVWDWRRAGDNFGKVKGPIDAKAKAQAEAGYSKKKVEK